jgi:hypothetical protein
VNDGDGIELSRNDAVGEIEEPYATFDGIEAEFSDVE